MRAFLDLVVALKGTVMVAARRSSRRARITVVALIVCAGLVGGYLITTGGPGSHSVASPRAAGAHVEVHYVGVAWSNGEQFDASWDRGDAFGFHAGARWRPTGGAAVGAPLY